MSDFMSITTTYKKLANQYGNFIVPAAKILVNGSDTITSMNLLLHELTVTLSLKAAGCAVIKAAGIYDPKNHSFRTDVKKKFQLGTVVEIEMGYLSNTQKLFKGYVASIGVEFGENELFVITLMDARRLMMTSGKKHLLYDVKNYSDAFKLVMESYTKLCTIQMDATDDKLENPISQTDNDYSFVTKDLVRKGQREFFILADKVYFRLPKKNKAPVMSVQYGRELLQLKVDHSYLDVSLEVIGYNKKEQKSVSSKKKVKGSESQTNVMPTAGMTVIDPDADSQEKAKNRVEAFALEVLNKSCKGNGIAVGIPEIVPGRYLEVENLEELADKKFYIEEVTHTLTSDKYYTYFDIGGCQG